LWFGGRVRMRGGVDEDEDDGVGVGTADLQDPVIESDDEDDDESPHTIAPNGLASRKAMHRNYEIMNQNDVARREEGGEERDFLVGLEAVGGGADMQLLFARAWMLASLQGGV
jgi:hypothetical protein